MSEARDLRLRVRQALDGRALSEAQVAAQLRVPRSQARNALRMLAGRDVVVGIHTARGIRYRLWSDVADELRDRPVVPRQAFPTRSLLESHAELVA